MHVLNTATLSSATTRPPFAARSSPFSLSTAGSHPVASTRSTHLRCHSGRGGAAATPKSGAICEMNIDKIFHMNGGAGENSYAQNSKFQSDILSVTKTFTEQALLELLNSGAIVGGKIGIAELGCSSGPTAFHAISRVLDVVYDTWQKRGGKSPEVAVYLNDLPGNDFNHLFESLSGFFEKLRGEKGERFEPCFVFGAPGSFYGRLFPSQSLHFVHSSTSLHWLSKIPGGLDPKARQTLNKGKIHLSKTSPKEVVEAYTKQFESDFSSFLDLRSKEVVKGGRMVLSLLGRLSNDTIEEDHVWEVLARSLMTLVFEGKVEEEKLDSFNLPYYEACPEEIKHLVEAQGSFQIDRIETFEISWDGLNPTQSNFEYFVVDGKKRMTRGEKVAKIRRAILEPIFECHFGKSIIDELFYRYGVMVDSILATRDPKIINLIVTLVRKSHED